MKSEDMKMEKKRGPGETRIERRTAPRVRVGWSEAAIVFLAVFGASRPAALPAQTYSEFPITTAGSRPVGIVAGPDGNLWFTQEVSRIGRISPVGVITEFDTSYNGLFGIAAGPDGNLWFTVMAAGESKICRITPAGVVTSFGRYGEFDSPAGIAAGPDGNLWFTELSGNRISRITTAGAVTQFSLPAGANPFDIAAGPDGNLWFTEQSGNKIGRITTAGDVTAEFWLPSAGSRPAEIAAGPDGNLWFTQASANRIGRITTAGVIAEFSIPSGGNAVGIAAGPDGNLWFTEQDRIGRITPSGVITEFSIPSGANAAAGIAAGPDGNLWFTAQNGIGRFTPGLPAGPCVADSTTLCLDGGRFQVRAEWQVPSQGASGQGMAVPVTSNTGSFWFFDSTNIEVVIKVLNACSLNSRYWVFAAGMTNVGVTLTVIDTQRDVTEIYSNPAGTAFQPIQDTAAFSTCP